MGLEETNLRSLASTNLPKLDICTLHSTMTMQQCMNIATKWHTTDTDGSEANSANKLINGARHHSRLLLSTDPWKHRRINEVAIRNTNNKVSHGFWNCLIIMLYLVLPWLQASFYIWGPWACFYHWLLACSLTWMRNLGSYGTSKNMNIHEYSWTVMPGCHRERTIESPNLPARIMVKVFPAPVEP